MSCTVPRSSGRHLAVQQREVELDRHQRLTDAVVQLARHPPHAFLEEVEALVRELEQLGTMLQNERMESRVGDRHRRAVAERRREVEEARLRALGRTRRVREDDADELRLEDQRQAQQLHGNAARRCRRARGPRRRRRRPPQAATRPRARRGPPSSPARPPPRRRARASPSRCAASPRRSPSGASRQSSHSRSRPSTSSTRWHTSQRTCLQLERRGDRARDVVERRELLVAPALEQEPLVEDRPPVEVEKHRADDRASPRRRRR